MASTFVDNFTFASSDLWISEFRLPPAHPDWSATRRTSGGAFLIAFPRTSVAISHEHRREVVADPMSAVIYSPAQVYRRRLVSAVGDDCTIVAVAPDLMSGVAREFDESADPQTFRVPFVASTVPRDSQMAIERIRRRVRHDADRDADAVREELYWIVRHVLSSGYQRGSPHVRSATAAAHRELADGVREIVGRDLSTTWSLDALARNLAVSPFHMVRVFRRVTGQPIHAFTTDLRLRSSLPLIADGMRLADVAQKVGFASHAHLTDRFVRAYGTTPTHWRETSKNMEARTRGAFIA